MVAVERNGLPLTAVSKTVAAENLASINEQIAAGKLRVALPIVGVRQKQSQGMMGEIEHEVLEEENVDFGKLQLNPLSRVGGKGGLRAAVSPSEISNCKT